MDAVVVGTLLFAAAEFVFCFILEGVFRELLFDLI